MKLDYSIFKQIHFAQSKGKNERILLNRRAKYENVYSMNQADASRACVKNYKEKTNPRHQQLGFTLAKNAYCSIFRQWY